MRVDQLITCVGLSLGCAVLPAVAGSEATAERHTLSLENAEMDSGLDFLEGKSEVSTAEYIRLAVDSKIGLEYDLHPHDPADPAAGAAADAASSDVAAATKPAGAHDHESLAVKLSNPIASLISVPFQFNWDTGSGPDDDKDKLLVNIQPVIPFSISKDWNLISRTIVPVVYQEAAGGRDDQFGVGDVLQSLFFSPKAPTESGWIWGVGPALNIPTGTDNLFRSKQFGAGPTGVFLKQRKYKTGTLTTGLLVNHLWRVAGSDDVRSLNNTFMQPFINWTTKTGTTFGLNTETSYNWTTEDWSVPINAVFSQMVMFGKQPTQWQFGGRYYLDTFSNGPEWGLRFQLTFLFPA